jgi:predicted dinucleotide-utilizing enzyme
MLFRGQAARALLTDVSRSRSGWVLRGAMLLLAFSCALIAFRAGVGVSDRAGLPGASVLTHVYYALGLFVLGGLDLGIPVGGPPAARMLLWLAYFAAPAITTSAVVEGALRLFSPAWLERRGLRDHVVVVGMGRLGMLFLEALREREPRTRVLAVDLDAHSANVQLAKVRFHARFAARDVRTAAALDAMVLERARAVVLLTDDDLANLEAAWRIAEHHERVQIVAHVADIGMRRTVATVEDETKDRVHVFNAHRIAAERLYDEHLSHHFDATAEKDVVVLAGFGRFGQTILEHLQREAHGELQRAIVVDVAAERSVRLFRAQVPGFEHCSLVTVQGDVEDPTTWERVERATDGLGVPPVYVLATDDDQVNLRAAIALRALHRDAKIFVRCVYESTFTRTLSAKLDFDVLGVEAMLRHALRDRVCEWTARK